MVIRGTDDGTRWVAGLAVVVVILLAAFTRPDTSDPTDTALYLRRARMIASEGLLADGRREPGYPGLLAGLLTIHFPVETSIALVQAPLFLATLYLFLSSCVGGARNRQQLLTVAACVGAIPTFAVCLNGALYTESVTASAIFALLAALLRLWSSFATNGRLASRLGWLTLALVCSAYLGVLKGSFAYIHVLFLPLLAVAAVATAGPRAPRVRAFVAVAALVCLVSFAASKLFLGAFGLQRFDRAGVIVYGKAVFVSRFDFRRETVPFVLNALSESACRKVYGAQCARWGFDAADQIGYELVRQGVSDDELWRRGWELFWQRPLRQLAFIPLELSRLIVHHTMTGFAYLDVPVLGPFSRSTGFALGLKLFNALVYLVPVGCLLLWRRAGIGLVGQWQRLPEVTRFAVALVGTYTAAYLAVYGLANAVIRMAFPLAAFPVLLAIGMVVVTRQGLRKVSEASQ